VYVIVQVLYECGMSLWTDQSLQLVAICVI